MDYNQINTAANEAAELFAEQLQAQISQEAAKQYWKTVAENIAANQQCSTTTIISTLLWSAQRDLERAQAADQESYYDGKQITEAWVAAAKKDVMALTSLLEAA